MGKLLTRKFLIAALALVASFVLAVLGRLDGGHFVTIVTIVVGAFTAAHTVADAVALKNGNGEAAK